MCAAAPARTRGADGPVPRAALLVLQGRAEADVLLALARCQLALQVADEGVLVQVGGARLLPWLRGLGERGVRVGGVATRLGKKHVAQIRACWGFPWGQPTMRAPCSCVQQQRPPTRGDPARLVQLPSTGRVERMPAGGSRDGSCSAGVGTVGPVVVSACDGAPAAGPGPGPGVLRNREQSMVCRTGGWKVPRQEVHTV